VVSDSSGYLTGVQTTGELEHILIEEAKMPGALRLHITGEMPEELDARLADKRRHLLMDTQDISLEDLDL
jgi:hypothetical protein